jgi:hypothetical protein
MIMRPVSPLIEVHASGDVGPLNMRHGTLGRPCHIMFRARTHRLRSCKLANMGSDLNQTNVSKRRSHGHNVAARQDLRHLGA